MNDDTAKIRIEVRDGQTRVEKARVHVFKQTSTHSKGARAVYDESKAQCSGETDEDGVLVVNVKPGRYNVRAAAFVEMEAQEVEVGECGCERVSFDLGLKLRVGAMVCRNRADADPCADVIDAVAGDPIKVTAEMDHPVNSAFIEDVELEFSSDRATFLSSDLDSVVLRSCDKLLKGDQRQAVLNTAGLEGPVVVYLTLSEVGSARMKVRSVLSIAPQRMQAIGGNVAVSLRRTATAFTADLPLWVVIRKSTNGLSFKNYQRFMDFVLCNTPLTADEMQFDRQTFARGATALNGLLNRRFLPFTDADAYRILKFATEAFVMVNCGVTGAGLGAIKFNAADLQDLVSRVEVGGGVGNLNRTWNNYLEVVNGTSDRTLPYLALIKQKLRDVGLKDSIFAIQGLEFQQDCYGILREKLTNPCLLELIWSYWHEEGMLVQTMNAISLRFQNRRLSDRDPLANLEIDPLRPLNNLIWGYIQDEQHRLTLQRRSYEYVHHYGMRLEGRAVPELRPADSRSKFIEAFHNLLHLASVFYKQDDDTTFIADGFPVLNALKEVHRIVAEGAHNQFGDLPSTARIEMLMQQWLLARPEFREYLPTRIMVAYEEPWMDRVDAMKKLQGWTDTSTADFHELAVFGEQLVLSVRYGSWSTVDDRESASNWARYWRSEIQGYIHSYRAVTGVDLTAEFTETRLSREAYLPPSVHLRRRLDSQRGGPGDRMISAAGTGDPRMAALRGRD